MFIGMCIHSAGAIVLLLEKFEIQKSVRGGEFVYFRPDEYITYGAKGLSDIRTKSQGEKEISVFDHLGSVRCSMKQDGTLIGYRDYEPFGAPLSAKQEKTRLGFIDKEQDKESSLADHGVRKYDYETGRFMSCDALWDKYLGWSPYQYSLNNPVRLIDNNGLWPGDPFASADDAALDFSKCYNQKSISTKREYGTRIYSYSENGKQVFKYSTPVKGTKDGCYPQDAIIPFGDLLKGAITDAYAHSHGNYLPLYGLGNDVFSKDDINLEGDYYFVLDKNKDLYMCSPNGAVRVLRANSMTDEQIGWGAARDKKDQNSIEYFKGTYLPTWVPKSCE